MKTPTALRAVTYRPTTRPDDTGEALRVSYPRPGALSLIPVVTLTCVIPGCDAQYSFTDTTPHVAIVSQRAALHEWDVTQHDNTVVVTCPTHSEPKTSFIKW